MEQSTEKNIWISEFRNFIDLQTRPVPSYLTRAVEGMIHQELNPPLSTVFVRLAWVHALVSVLTISLCPHFGIQIIPGFGGMPAFFMNWGENFCMLACGCTFMSLGLLTAVFLVPSEHVYVLRKHRLLGSVMLTFLSCAVLLTFGNAFLSTVPLWLLGGLFGSFAALQIGTRLRYAF